MDIDATMPLSTSSLSPSGSNVSVIESSSTKSAVIYGSERSVSGDGGNGRSVSDSGLPQNPSSSPISEASDPGPANSLRLPNV
jgi:hypothetical protein